MTDTKIAEIDELLAKKEKRNNDSLKELCFNGRRYLQSNRYG